MAAPERAVFFDGQLASNTDFTAIGANVEAFLSEVLQYLLGNRDLFADSGAVVPSATDVAGNAISNYGFFGPSFRVVRVSATRIVVTAGLGLQYGTSGVPAGERALRFVRLGESAPEAQGGTGITITSLPTAGQWKRALVTTQWRDVTIDASIRTMDSSGNETTTTEATRQRPEVGALDGAASGITVTYGTAAASATLATRPSVPSGHVVLAELLLDSTGLAAAANPDGLTSGITDLRPRITPSKAAGAYDARRATCSQDESTGARNLRRMGAKMVGVVERSGFVQIPVGSAAIVTLDTSTDWRDCMVDVRLHALSTLDSVPGGVSDTGYRRSLRDTTSAVETANNPGIDLTVFYSEVGSADGLTGATSEVCRTGADHADTELTFFADSTSGALKCLGIAGGTNRELYFVATARGPLGKSPASGVES